MTSTTLEATLGDPQDTLGDPKDTNTIGSPELQGSKKSICQPPNKDHSEAPEQAKTRASKHEYVLDDLALSKAI